MDDITLNAYNVAKGELSGDPFLWDAEMIIEGELVKGVFKSTLEKPAEE